VAKDFEAFCTTYFTDLFSFPSCKEQRRMTEAAMTGRRVLSMFAADREFGKTVRFFAFKIWCGCFGHKHSYGKASDTMFPRTFLAVAKTLSNMGSVSLPVNVFCWLG
jgi:hypothetical protein